MAKTDLPSSLSAGKVFEKYGHDFSLRTGSCYVRAGGVADRRCVASAWSLQKVGIALASAWSLQKVGIALSRPGGKLMLQSLAQCPRNIRAGNRGSENHEEDYHWSERAGIGSARMGWVGKKDELVPGLSA